MIFILILIVIIILVFLVFISLSSSFKIIKIEESNNKLNLEIVNYFGTRDIIELYQKVLIMDKEL